MSLQIAENTMNVGDRGVNFICTGLTKQDRPSHDGSHRFVPSYQDKSLDPRRRLMRYIRKTKKYRKEDDHNAVKLVNLIKLVYKLKKKSLKNKKIQGHSTRSVGTSWALFKGASLRQVMGVGRLVYRDHIHKTLFKISKDTRFRGVNH